MYIYLDKQGIVKEIINDEALRQSANNVNEIYVYYDGLQESDIGSVLTTYGLPDGTITDEMQVAKETEEKEIPYDAERDLKYFQYYKAYAFYHFAIADLALSQEGVVRLMLRLAQKDGEYIKVAGLICFDVEGELIKDDHGVSLAQYNYLVKAWMGTKECLPLDGSKAMRADLDMGTHSVVLNGKALKDKNGALNYNGKDLAKQEDVTPLQGDVATLKTDNTKNKEDIASLKSDNTANKAGISALKTDNTKNKENIVGLQNQIDAINATQNVVDIVGTKAELNAYETKDLHANDKIEVLVDESQNDANTIYEWNGNAWSLIGSKAPYYSKAESDARYNELKAKSYDKDTTGYVTGHVPDSGMVKGSLDSISESVETLSIEAVKKNTDASLKSVTIPTASDLKTKDGSKIGALPSPWVVDETVLGIKNGQNNSDHTGLVNFSGFLTGYGAIRYNGEEPSQMFIFFPTFSTEDTSIINFGDLVNNINSSVKLPANFLTEDITINLGDINTNKNDIATLKTKSYDKDATLDDLTQGHVPDSNVVKGISVDVKANRQMIDTIGEEVTKSIKKDTDASLKSLTLPSASALKTKDGTGFENAVYESALSEENGIYPSEGFRERWDEGKVAGILLPDNDHATFIPIRDGSHDGYFAQYNLDKNNIYFRLQYYSYADNIISYDNPPIVITLQNKLVSGTNIKTINGESVLGEGDIPIQPKLYRHTITLNNTTISSYFVFTINMAMQDEVTKDTLFNVMNGYVCDGTGVVQNNFIDKITFKATDETTKVHQCASFAISGYINSEATFKSVFGTDYTLKDVVQL